MHTCYIVVYPTFDLESKNLFERICISVKPSFEKNQELVTVNEDDTNSLVCNASSNPASRVTWLKDNTPITGSRYTTRQKVFRGTGQTLGFN